MATNTYDTFCEAPGCRESVVYRAADMDAAVAYLTEHGWSALFIAGRGYQSYCPTHKDGRTETMQRCSECGNWCQRTVNTCPTCSAVTCLVCGDPAYELQLCRDHFGEHIEWKRREGYGSENRVEQWLAYEQMREEAFIDAITAFPDATEAALHSVRTTLGAVLHQLTNGEASDFLTCGVGELRENPSMVIAAQRDLQWCRDHIAKALQSITVGKPEDAPELPAYGGERNEA